MSSAGRTEMVKNLNKIVVPVLRNLNFKGSFPHFRRETKERINTLTFQFDRSGGGFIIEIANCGPGIFYHAVGDFRLNPVKSLPTIWIREKGYNLTWIQKAV